MLSIRGVSKTYKDGTRALQGVDLDVPPGVYGLLGPNGAGKTTLMRIIATLHEPDEGQVRLDGIDAAEHPKQLRSCLGYLPQSFGFDSTMRVKEILRHFAVLKGLGKQVNTVVDPLLSQLDLEPLANRRFGALSGGMKQRVGLAQALLGSPRLVILDEPTAGLDPEQRARIHELLASVADESIVLLSTHIAEDVRRLCTEMSVLAEGRIRYTGALAGALDGLRGRLWETEQSVDEADRVVRVRLQGGRRLTRVYRHEPPQQGYWSVEPELEDIYYLALRRDMSAAFDLVQT